MDHRGTSRFPGYVATLVADSYLKEIGLRNDAQPPSKCTGTVFLVPNDEAEELIAELDFREKGGYHRHVLPVKFLVPTPYHRTGEVGQALVYTGSTDNPNFCQRVADRQWQRRVAHIISAAIGPSGANAQYLLNLYSFVRGQGVVDEYLTQLSVEVVRAISPWRGRLLLLEEPLTRGTDCTADSGSRRDDALETQKERGCDQGESVCLVGWGSNESEQLQLTSQSHHRADLSGRDGLLFRAEVIYIDVDRLGGHAAVSTCPLGRVLQRQVYAGGSRSGLQIGTTLYMWGDLRAHGCNDGNLAADTPCWVWKWDSEGRGSTRITRSLLTYFSCLQYSQTGPDMLSSSGGMRSVLVLPDVVCASFGYSHTLVLLTSGLVLAFGSDDHGQCSGGDGALAVHLDGCHATSRDSADPLAASAPAASQHDTDRRENSADELTYFPFGVTKLAAGLHHSAAITSIGVLVTWGCHGCASPSSRILEAPWLPPLSLPGPTEDKGSECFTGAPSDILVEEHCGVVPVAVDVCCGAKHTVVLDSVGRLFTFGDNKFGQLGRTLQDVHDHSGGGRAGHTCRVPTPVGWNGGHTIYKSVHWKEVCAGWSHNVARGVTIDGEVVFVGWGRNDMGQLSSDSKSRIVPFPTPLEAPSDRRLASVWCGSEFVVARTVDGDTGTGGELWGRGWSEHGNLGHGWGESGNGAGDRCSWEWLQTLLAGPDGDCVAVEEWEGLVSCGGAHCLALTAPLSCTATSS